MLTNPDYITARDLLLKTIVPIETEWITLSASGGRILAQNIIAAESIPPFDRSPYNGYAFRAADTAHASSERPVTLQILEEVPAGAVPKHEIIKGTAAKILTGAPIPHGADAVIKFEQAKFTEEIVTIFSPCSSGQNITHSGAYVHKSDMLAYCGDVINPDIAGLLASQGIAAPSVYRIPKVGILSTGSELVEANEVPGPGPGKIRNSSRHVFEAALKSLGCEYTYLGIAGDTAEEICALLKKGIAEYDIVLSTGGVAAGNGDLMLNTMQMAGVKILFQGVDIKPGMACAYGIQNKTLVCALSGDPVSALTNFYAVALPAFRKLMGCRNPIPQEIEITLSSSFNKSSPQLRFLRGSLELNCGRVCMSLLGERGNVMSTSSSGCTAMAIIPAGSGPISAGTVLKGFLL